MIKDNDREPEPAIKPYPDIVDPDPDIMPGPINPPMPGTTAYFQFAIGEMVKTIYGETGYIEMCAIQRSGVMMYLVQTTMKDSAWMDASQIERINKPIDPIIRPFHQDQEQKEKVKPQDIQQQESLGFDDETRIP